MEQSAVYIHGMEYLVGVVQSLSQVRTLPEVVSIVRHAARELTGADGASFVLREGDLCSYVDEEAIAPLWKGKKFPMGSCISGWAMLNCQTVTIEDIYKDPRIPADVYRPTFVKSLALVPIRRKIPIGAIGNYWSKNYKATPDQVRLLEALADSTSVAIANVQLISDLQEANQSLENALRSRDDFLSVAAHELRTPLSTLKLQLQMTDRQIQSSFIESMSHQEIEGAIKLSLKQVSSLTNLVEQLLEISKIRLGKLVLEYSSFNFSQLVRQTVEQLMPTMNAAHCPVELEIDDFIKGEWDQTCITQILTNLLSNVCKYAPSSLVKISTKEDGRGSVTLAVEDHGPGLKKEMCRRVFDRFERGVSAEYSSGLGLGLFITRNLAEAHGGHVRVESESGMGAKFIVELPMIPPDGARNL